jgi:hypothetical protein
LALMTTRFPSAAPGAALIGDAGASKAGFRRLAVMHPYPPRSAVHRPRSIAIARPAEDQAWRGRTLAACSLLGLGVVAIAAAQLDWSEGPAMALGQLAGVVAPLAVLGLSVWCAAALAGGKAPR